MANPGALRGNVDFRGTYNPIPRGGSWGGNRGRMSIDEIRMWGYPDNGSVGAGGSRLINTNALQGNPGLAYPQDVGSIVNILAGTVTLNGVGTPFNAMYNSAGTIRNSTSSTATTAVFENNTVIRNTPGNAVSLLTLDTVVGVTTYLADGAACTLGGTHTDFTCGTIFAIGNAGTMTASNVINYNANIGAQSGATITNYTAFKAQDVTSVTGAITNLVSVDLPFNSKGVTLNNALRVGVPANPLTVQPLGNVIDLWQGTVELNFANASLANVSLVASAGTIQVDQSASVLGLLGGMFSMSTIFTNKPSTAANLSAVIGFRGTPTFTANGASISVSAALPTACFNAVPIFSASNAGTLSAVTIANYRSGGTAISGATNTVTVTQLTGFQVTDVTTSGAGTNTFATHIGMDIAALSTATVSIGLRNAATSVYTPSTVQALVAATTVLPNATTIRVTSTASIVMSSTPTVSTTNVQNGQILTILCENTTAARTITFTSQGTLASSALSLGATTRALGPKGSLTLQFDTTLGEWIEIGFNPGSFG